MTLTLRTYQREAIDAVFDYWQNEPGNPLIDLATGTGKSLVMAQLITELLSGWPHMRVVIAAQACLLFKASPLFDGIDQFGISIREFATANKQLESLSKRGIFTMSTRQR